MDIRLATITGADDDVELELLGELAQEFPFVEFGILRHDRSHGVTRYPGRAWIEDGLDAGLRLTAHICAGWMRQLGRGRVPAVLRDELPRYHRVQLNIGWVSQLERLIDPAAVAGALAGVLRPGQEVVLQLSIKEPGSFAYEPRVFALARELVAVDLVPSILLDPSLGRGRTADAYPPALVDYPCGYCGGLKPSNVAERLEAIAEAAGDATIWVGMESGVRTRRRFDGAKARRYLEICQAWAATEVA